MVRGKSLSCDMRNSIVAAHESGLSGHKIAKNLSIPQGTVRNIISQFKKTGNIQTKVKTGRASKITKRDERALRTLIKQDRRASSRELAVKWADAIGRPISKDTCLRRMKKMGYGFYKVSFYKHKNIQTYYFILGEGKTTSFAKTKTKSIFVGKGAQKLG